MNNKNKELSSLDKLKNILRRKADDGVKISVAKAGWLLNLAYAAGQHKAVKDAKGLKWVELPIKIQDVRASEHLMIFTEMFILIRTC